MNYVYSLEDFAEFHPTKILDYKGIVLDYKSIILNYINYVLINRYINKLDLIMISHKYQYAIFHKK